MSRSFGVIGCLVLACGAGGGGASDGEEPPCTYEGAYFVAYALMTNDPACPAGVAPTVELLDSDERQCTTACGFSDGNACETTFVCQPGNPVIECAGAELFRVNLNLGGGSLSGSPQMFCEYELTLLRMQEAE